MRLTWGMAVALLVIGCATPRGSYRDYFGFHNEPPAQPSEQSKQSSVEGYPQWRGREVETYVVFVPGGVYSDWYAPWYPYPLHYCAPRAYWHFRSWHCWWCYPYPAPPVVVVVPQEPEPPRKVRTFGPARGNVERVQADDVQAEAGGGRMRSKSSGSAVEERKKEQRSPGRTGEEGGRARMRGEESQRENLRAVEVGAEDSSASAGGGRSRRKP